MGSNLLCSALKHLVTGTVNPFHDLKYGKSDKSILTNYSRILIAQVITSDNRVVSK
jgi:hypothetical protein